MNNTTTYLLLAALLTGGMAFSIIKRKLTPTAAVTGAMVALLLFTAGGFTAVLMMTAFFITGTAATSHKKILKQQQVEADGHSSPRDVWQVLANSGVPGIVAFAILLAPGHKHELLIMIAGAFATATGDTASSELGMVYGRNFYNIITLKKDTRGLDGVISIEGTLLGIAVSMLIAIVYSINFGWGWAFAVITLSGLAGNLTDSLLGAVLERRHRLGNNSVNFLATLAGAAAAWLMA